MSQVRKEKKERKRSLPHFSCLPSCFGRESVRDSRTRVLNVAQCWQSCVWVHSVGAPNFVAQRNMAIQTKKKKQQSPSKPIYPTSAYIPHKPAVGCSILTCPILTSLYIAVPWGMHFKTMSGMPRFLWFLGHTKTDSTPQHIRWPLQYLFNTHMISNTCPSAHTWYLLWYDKEQGRGEKIGKSLFSHVVLARSGGLGATPVYPWSSLWYGWGSLCNWIYCQRIKQSGGGVLCVFAGHRGPKM